MRSVSDPYCKLLTNQSAAWWQMDRLAYNKCSLLDAPTTAVGSKRFIAQLAKISQHFTPTAPFCYCNISFAWPSSLLYSGVPSSPSDFFTFMGHMYIRHQTIDPDVEKPILLHCRFVCVRCLFENLKSQSPGLVRILIACSFFLSEARPVNSLREQTVNPPRNTQKVGGTKEAKVRLNVNTGII